MVKKIFLGIILFLILSPFLLLPINSQAQEIGGHGLTISPPVSEYNLQPGQAFSQIIRLSNPTQKIVEVYPLVMNFLAKDESGTPRFYPATEEEKGFSLARWVEFSPERIVLFPTQSIEWPYKIVVPIKAEPGGHYGVIFFATNPPEKKQNVSEISLASMLGSLILVRTPGDIHEQGSIVEFSAKRFDFSPPVNFRTRISNSGNVHFKPVGEITIKNWLGKEVGKGNINEAKGNILPESIRKFDAIWSPQIPNFIANPIGRFSADLKITYGDKQQILKSSLVFWLIPLWLIILITVIIVLLIIGLIVKLIRRKK